jgi:hypothetical protein
MTMIFAIQEAAADDFVKGYSGAILILLVFILIVVTLIILVPQLLRAHLRKVEMQHLEHLKALEHGAVVPPRDDSAQAAGRTATLVPIVVVICAATVTCFLVAYRPELVFGVALAVWSVARMNSTMKNCRRPNSRSEGP